MELGDKVCAICNGEMPEGRIVTCCHECHLLHRFQQIERKKRGLPVVCKQCGRKFYRKKKPVHMLQFNTPFCSTACFDGHKREMGRRGQAILDQIKGLAS